jgi:hypothetical protein
MEPLQNKRVYENYSDKELIKIWEEDVKGCQSQSANRMLMKAIADNEEKSDDGNSIPLHSKRMWDSETSAWVPFEIWGAHHIVNDRKEYVQLQHWSPVDIQPEFGETLKGWKSLDSSYLNEMLKEKPSWIDQFNQNSSFSCLKGFYEVIKQDQQEKRNEGDYSDTLGISRNNRRL